MKSLVLISGVLALLIASSRAGDSLPSWNNTGPKKAIIAFVEQVTKPGSPAFVPVAERIATFDNDGTLWAEQPVYFQVCFACDRIKALAPQHPEWTTLEPFASVLKGDLNSALAGGDRAQLALTIAAQSGITTEEFAQTVADWIVTSSIRALAPPAVVVRNFTPAWGLVVVPVTVMYCQAPLPVWVADPNVDALDWSVRLSL